MQYRTLGKTGLQVSVVGFGASSLGGVFHHVTEDDCRAAVCTALDLGVNFIDVAPYYGLTKAETMLGKCLQGAPRDSYILATKVGRYGPDLPDFDFSPARITRSVDESLARLKTDHVDLIQVHDIEFGNVDRIISETLPALRKVQEAGKAKFVGITGLPVRLFKYVAERAVIDTILSYCHYELNDTALLDILPAMQAMNVGIISASPLGMGLLSKRGAPAWHPAPDALKQACRQAADLCAARGTDIEKLALQFSLQHPAIASTLVGSANPANVRKNLQWAEEPLDPTLLRDVLALLQPVHNLTWPSGRAENN